MKGRNADDRLSWNHRQGARGTQALCQPPFQSGLPRVYLSADKALASIYIWKHPFKWMTFEIGEDGIPVYNESFKDGLRAFYGGVKGVIYTCSGSFGTDKNTGIRSAVVSRDPVPVAAADEVDDAYNRILPVRVGGAAEIRHYEDLTVEERRRDRNMVRGAIRPAGSAAGGASPVGVRIRNLPGMVGGSAAGGRGRRRRMTARRLEKTDLARWRPCTRHFEMRRWTRLSCGAGGKAWRPGGAISSWRRRTAGGWWVRSWASSAKSCTATAGRSWSWKTSSWTKDSAGRGPAGCCWRELKKAAAARNCAQMILVTEEEPADACGFYEAYGFDRRHRGYKKTIARGDV